ncbi:peptidase domain-containing ABC transporter [Candidatus Enterococcus clewellii]|uniref:ATP-binding cassette, subfamily C, bacteriocin exporter n=1 Tax=Candidatus Enterococcus clewellii TaxID=1834193 RepID=A0AAQ3VR32_9ENTE
MKKKIIPYLQQDETDCGVACMYMLLTYYNSKVPIHILRVLSGTGTQGTSALGIKKCGNALGLEVSVYNVSKKIMSKEFFSNPFIAHIKLENGFEHYVLCYKKKGEYIYFVDPATGKERLKESDFVKKWSGIIIDIFPSEDYSVKIVESFSLFSYLKLFVDKKRTFIFVFFVSLFISAVGIANSYYQKFLIDQVIPKNNISMLHKLFIVLLLILVFRSFMNYLKNVIVYSLSQKMNFELNSEFLKHILKLPLDFFYNRKTGEIISRVNDIEIIIDFLKSFLVDFIVDILMLIIMSLVLMFLNFKLFLIALISIPIYIPLTLYFSEAYKKKRKKVLTELSNFESVYIEMINGMETIKSFRKEHHFYGKVSKQLDKYIVSSKELSKISYMQEVSKGIIYSTIILFTMWLGGYLVINNRMSLGSLVAYSSMYMMFSIPLDNLLMFQLKYQSAVVSNDRLNDIMDISNENLMNNKMGNFDILIQELRYNIDTKNMTNNLTVKIKQGEKIVLVGKSGSGKSTLAKMLVGIVEPNQGDIHIGDLNIKFIDKDELRKHILYVPQKPYLFKGTILENIILEDDLYDLDRIKKCCQIAEISDFIQKTSNGLETQLYEGATNISIGQQQRIILARAFYHNFKILILDEATSGLDSNTEMKIVENILKMDQTVILITHNETIISMFERKINLE